MFYLIHNIYYIYLMCLSSQEVNILRGWTQLLIKIHVIITLTLTNTH